MGHSNGKITAPVNTDDVSAVLGVNSHSFTTLCRSGSINPAALYRPRYTQRPDIDLKSTASGNGFNYIATQISQRPNVNYDCPAYGIWVPKLTINNPMTDTAMSALFAQCRNTWYIAPPSGNSFDPIMHFDGYNHGAKVTVPVRSATVQVTKRTQGGNTITVNFTTPVPDKETMSVSNLFGGKGWYFGAVVFRGTDKSGWNKNDVMFIGSASAQISGTTASAPSITITDASAGTGEVVYRVIPFVCNKANLTKDTLSGVTFYGIRIDNDCVSWVEKTIGGVVMGDGENVQYFNYKEGSDGYFYPIPGNNSVGYATPPHLVFAYAEDFNTARYSSLLQKYNRVDITIITYQNGKPFEYTYTWMKSGGNAGNGTLVRDTRFDSQLGHEDLMLFNIPTFFTSAMEIEDFNDVTGTFYWTDEYGYEHQDIVFATYTPIDTNQQ